MVFVNEILPFNKQKLQLNKQEGEDKLTKQLSTKRIIMVACLVSLAVLIVIIVPTVTIYTTKKYSQENLLEPGEGWLPFYESSSELGKYSSAAISTDANHCAPIGRDILERNGSAVDAAIAVLLCMGVVNPQSMGLGGGFLMLVYEKDKRQVHFINAREKAPLKATENMFSENGNLSKYGGLSVAVPGELIGYEKAHQLFGSLSWDELFQPTIDMCRKGIKVSKHLDKHLGRYAHRFKGKHEWRFFFDNKTNEVYKEGDIFFRPDLAETLEIMARDGSDALYNKSHPLAKKFMKDLRDIGSIITEEDMEKYSVEITKPVEVQLLDNATLYSANIPGSGALLGMMTNILRGYNITENVKRSKNESVLTLHRILEAFKFAYSRRFELEDNKETMPAFIANVTSKEYAEKIRTKIFDDKTFQDIDYYGIHRAFTEDHGTASMAIIASNGDAVVVTSTVNLYFGSTVISESTGLILNDEMDDFSSPDVISYFDIPPSPFNRIKPERRPTSSMCPTIVLDHNGDARLAISGNGGTKITTSVFQVILRNMWLGENIKAAIDAPRFHHQLLPNYVSYENDFPKDIIEELKKRGHIFEKNSGMSGIIVGLARGTDGKIYANSDYRKGGDIAGF